MIFFEKPQKKGLQNPETLCLLSDLGAIRTRDPQLRRLLLYPAELRDRVYCEFLANIEFLCKYRNVQGKNINIQMCRVLFQW